jgi:hypothetical protein
MRLLTAHPMTRRECSQDHGKIQPSLTRPDIADVARPFLVWQVCCEVSIQQIGCDVELVVAIGRGLVFSGPDNGYTILAHQTAHTAMANIQADLLQLWSSFLADHSCPG